eukprot:641168-Lingulodinium_polyedra.AAC.1
MRSAGALELIGMGEEARPRFQLPLADALRIPVRYRQPRTAACDHLIALGWAPFLFFTGFACVPPPELVANID